MPSRIFAHVANLLPKKHKSRQTPSNTMRDLHQLFAPDGIVIDRQPKLDNICLISVYSSDDQEQSNWNIRKLILDGMIEVNDEQLSILQRHFQNIQHLTIRRVTLNSLNFGDTTDWSLWKSLTELKIGLDIITVPNPEEEFLAILSCLPRLTHLEVTRPRAIGSPTFTFQAIETLHQRLPELEYLSLSIDLVNLSPDDLLNIANVKPATSLVLFQPNKIYSDHRWLYYFVKKYPNLHTIGTMLFEGTRRSDTFYNPDEYQDIITSIFKDPLSGFPCLTRVRALIERHAEPAQIAFWDLFCSLNVPLTHLHCCFDIVETHTNTFENRIKRCMYAFSKTIAKLYIHARFSPYDPWVLTKEFTEYPCLSELIIGVHRAIIELDTLLDHCPVLKKLNMSSESLILSPSTPASPVKHNLQILDVVNMEISANVLDYVSLRCQGLKHMRLNGSRITGPVDPKTGNLYIDMSYTDFDIIQLTSICFNTSEYGNDPRTNINILKFVSNTTHQKAEEPTKHQTKPKLLLRHRIFREANTDNVSLNENDSESNLSSKWYYMFYGYISQSKYSTQAWILTKEEVEHAQKYFSNFEYERSLAEKTEDYYTGNQESTKDNWKLDLDRGYVTWKCGNVTEFSLNQPSNDDGLSMKNIFDDLH
ncbi:hypothetical protein J3Q64DRAFT_1176586 [Phycomyces blakesleeanus]|uniref:Uncharacterized protein n=1 Tax=Phycomyces blakesleeanus TaxID=4837 RepID=A0ABR3ASZ6_PHYBL